MNKKEVKKNIQGLELFLGLMDYSEQVRAERHSRNYLLHRFFFITQKIKNKWETKPIVRRRSGTAPSCPASNRRLPNVGAEMALPPKSGSNMSSFVGGRELLDQLYMGQIGSYLALILEYDCTFSKMKGF